MKYEHYIETNFNPYSSMHESRQHSNLWGKDVLWGKDMIEGDPIGYYKHMTVHPEPTMVHFHERYPDQAQAWLYDDLYMDETFKMEDTEDQYLRSE